MTSFQVVANGIEYKRVLTLHTQIRSRNNNVLCIRKGRVAQVRDKLR